MFSKRNIVIYVSGAYTGEIDKNIEIARKAAIDLWEKGYTVICPHLNTIHFEKDCKIGYDDYIVGDCEILKRCNYILMLDNWEDSKGAKVEKEFAEKYNIKIYYTVEELEDYISGFEKFFPRIM